MKAKAGLKSGMAGLKIRRILVPLDFSGVAQRALHYAVALATDAKAKIVLLHVVEPVYVSTDPGLTYVAQPVIAQEKIERKKMESIAEKFIPAGLFEKAVLRQGAAYHEITVAAKELKADLIVITTHGRTGLSHVVMGSTAERVVRHAPCPVLTVRRPE